MIMLRLAVFILQVNKLYVGQRQIKVASGRKMKKDGEGLQLKLSKDDRICKPDQLYNLVLNHSSLLKHTLNREYHIVFIALVVYIMLYGLTVCPYVPYVCFLKL